MILFTVCHLYLLNTRRRKKALKKFEESKEENYPLETVDVDLSELQPSAPPATEITFSAVSDVHVENNELQRGGTRGKRRVVAEEEEGFEDKFEFYIYSEAPTRSYIHKEESESVLLQEENFVPPEGHCSAISIEKKEEMRIFVYGGHYPESTHKTNENNSIIILKFKLENRIVFQEKSEGEKQSTQVYPSSKFWVITQATNCSWGSYLPPMSYSDMTFVENDLIICFGHNYNYNETSEEVFRISNMRKEGIKRPQVIQIPGREMKGKLINIPPGFRCQCGDIPIGGRAGHRIFTITKEHILLISGHSLEKQERSPFKHLVHPTNNLYVLNTRNYEWVCLQLSEENEFLLQRTHFGACQDKINGNCFYICGGIRKEEDTSCLQTLSALTVLKLTITATNSISFEARIEIIEIISDFDNLLLSSFSLSLRNEILYITGGNQGKRSSELRDSFVKNSNIILLHPTRKTLNIVKPPDIIKGKFSFYKTRL